MSAPLWFAIGYIAGGAVALFLMHPIRQFNKGYEEAKKMYGDWQKGFDYGWKGAFSAMQILANQYFRELYADDEDDEE